MANRNQPSAPRPGPFARLAAWLDQAADDADKEAAEAGLLAESPSRWRRVYRDPRYAALGAVRAAGCTHVPGHLTYGNCDLAAIYVPRKDAA